MTASTRLRLVAEIPNWRPTSKQFGGNARKHPFAKAQLAKVAQKKVGDALLVHRWPRELPAGRKFTLTFHVYQARGKMDSDNGIAVLKETRDAVAGWLSTHDGPSGPITWEYEYHYGVTVDRVEIVLEEVG